jgi:hypothetical protein
MGGRGEERGEAKRQNLRCIEVRVWEKRLYLNREREENGKALDPQSTSRSLTTTTREDVQPLMKAPKVRKTDEEAVGLLGGR